MDYNTFEFKTFEECIGEFHDGKVIKGLMNMGFLTPSIIQRKCLKPILDNRDLVAQSQSGTGKTGAFLIGMITKINLAEKFPQGIILVHTRVLATQIYNIANEMFKFIGEGTKNKLKISICTGGNQQDNDEKTTLNNALNSHILICTPGRIKSLLSYNKMLLAKIKIMVLDEVDGLLEHKLLDQVSSILKCVNRDAQISCFSATMHSDSLDSNLVHFINDPVVIRIKNDADIKIDKIQNYMVNAKEERYKYETLLELYTYLDTCQSIIFVNTREKADVLYNDMIKKGYIVGVIHKEIDDIDRITTMKKFSNGFIRTLISTDVLARGIDIKNVGLVINYDIPRGKTNKEQYLHRVGRCGRYGKVGVAINLLTDDYDEQSAFKDIINFYKVCVNKIKIDKIDEINKYLTGLDGYNFTLKE